VSELVYTMPHDFEETEIELIQESDGTWAAIEPRGIVAGYGQTTEEAIEQLYYELEKHGLYEEGTWIDNEFGWGDYE